MDHTKVKHALNHYWCKTVQAALNHVKPIVLIVKNSVHSPFLCPYKNAEIFLKQKLFQSECFPCHLAALHFELAS